MSIAVNDLACAATGDTVTIHIPTMSGELDPTQRRPYTIVRKGRVIRTTTRYLYVRVEGGVLDPIAFRRDDGQLHTHQRKHVHPTPGTYITKE